MATLRQYFDTDFSRLLKSSQVFSLSDGVEDLQIPVSLHYDFDANARFLSCFLRASDKPLSACVALMRTVDQLLAVGEGLDVRGGFIGERPMRCETLRFCGRIFFYCEEDIPSANLDQLQREAEAKGLFIQFRGPQFAEERSRLEKPLAFISHDSRDKDDIARPLAIELSKLMCPVWYDEFSLRLGDSLRESIENGLKEARKCILILSKHFLSNRGWTKTEFNAVFTREILEGINVVLPIWCGIGKNELYEYSPTLVERVGVKWDRGLAEVVREIRRAVV